MNALRIHISNTFLFNSPTASIAGLELTHFWLADLSGLGKLRFMFA